MSVQEFTEAQVIEALEQIETCYKRVSGDIDLLEMSKNPNVYPVWLDLRKRLRAQEKEAAKRVSTGQ